MTAMHPQPVRFREPPARECLDTLTLSWEILADVPAVRALLREHAGVCRARVVLVVEARGVRAFLETHTRPDGSAERLPLSDVVSPLTLSKGRVGGVELVHAYAPGVLRATLVLDADNPPRVLYARTPLLAALRLAGGACDRPAAAWERETGGPC